MKYFMLIWAGLWRKPMRTVLSMLVTVVAFSLFGLLQGMKTGVDQAIADARGDLLLVRSRVSSGDSLPLTHLGRIKQVAGVKLALAQDGLIATFQRPTQGVAVAAFTPDKNWSSAYPNFKVAPEHLDAFVNTRTGALVSVDLAEKYGWKIGDRIPLNSSTPQLDGSAIWVFDVVGIFSSDDGVDTAKGFIIINLDYLDAARQFGRGAVSLFNVVVSDPSQAVRVADEIDRLFANSSHETRTESLRELAQAQMQAIGDLDFVIRSIVSAVFVALLFASSTMMMQSIRERTSEVAVLKALGFSDIAVFSLLLVEAIIVCMVAAAFGLALAALGFPLAAKMLPAVSFPKIIIPIVLVAGLLVAVISVSVPAFRAARLQVADALAGR